MTEQLTGLRVLELLERVVKREGRDTVRPCWYVAWPAFGEPAPYCVVACVLTEVGVTLDQLIQFGSQSVILLHAGHRLDDVVDLSDDVATILQLAQSVQDDKLTWGRALAAARREAWRLGIIGKDHHRRHASRIRGFF